MQKAAFLITECKQDAFAFAPHFSRRVEAGFTAGQVCSDGGALLLREVDRKINLIGRLAACFSDGREAERVKHKTAPMLAQRIFGLALGYEDLNDHEQLRSGPLFALLAGQRELEQPLAGKSTLNRLELAGTLVEALRRLGLKGTEWAEAQVDTIRLKLFKIGAIVRISARRVWLELSSTYPWKQIYAKAFDALRC